MTVIFLLLSINVALVRSLDLVDGFVGESVTLRPRVDQSGVLSTIEWSIFSNNTWIATLQGGKVNVNRVQRYAGRLSLNTSTGALTISDLNEKDSMEYTLDLITVEGSSRTEKIKLDVKKRLQKPFIKYIVNKPGERGCWIGLRCSSPDSHVRFSWQISPPVRTFTSEEDSGVLFVFLNSTQVVMVTCNSSSSGSLGSTSSSVEKECGDTKPTPHHGPDLQPSCRSGLHVFIGVVLGVILTLAILLAIKYLKGRRTLSLPSPTAKL